MAPAALHCSRIGAAHRRQGRPCQDFSLSHRCRDAAGQPVLVLAVADGHGGARYSRSERGSRLACELAVAEIERALGAGQAHGSIAAAMPAAGPDPDLEPWRRWLAQELPELLHRRWLEAIATDWGRDPAPADGEGEGSFSPLHYGTTLGLVVITARWWGHTGLGDWDLVRVEADGQRASLVSEEPAQAAAGEATCSLCQRQAARLFASRSALHRRRAGEAFALVLSSDGVRKSCATDADFLALAAHLAATPAGAAGALASALDQISREGSGDDVSVAMARLEGALPSASPDPTLPPARPAAVEVPAAARRRWRVRPLLLALGAAAALGLALPRLLPRSRPAPGGGAAAASLAALPLELQASLRRSIAQLCASPASLRASLLQRHSQFEGLTAGRLQARQLQRNAAIDPLGALIGTAFLVRGPQPAPRTLQALGACPELEAALAAAWGAGPADRRMGAKPPTGPAGPRRPPAPPP